MKGINFNEDEFSEIISNRGKFDDGAYISLVKSRIQHKKGCGKTPAYLTLSNKMIKEILPGANCVKLMLKNNKLGIKLMIDSQDSNIFSLRKLSKNKMAVNATLLKAFTTKKYFEDDVMADFANNTVVIEVEFDKEFDKRYLE